MLWLLQKESWLDTVVLRAFAMRCWKVGPSRLLTALIAPETRALRGVHLTRRWTPWSVLPRAGSVDGGDPPSLQLQNPPKISWPSLFLSILTSFNNPQNQTKRKSTLHLLLSPVK